MQNYIATTFGITAEKPFFCQHVFNRPLSNAEHNHNFYEIYILAEGWAKHIVNGVVLDMKEASCVVIPPAAKHLFLQQSEGIEMFCLSIYTPEMEQLLDAYGIRDKLLKSDVRVATMDRQEIFHARNIFRQMRLPHNSHNLSCQRIVLGMVLHSIMRKMIEVEEEWIDGILAKMNSPEYLKEGVPALLRLSNLSHAQLCRVVKKRMNMTPQEYIKELRMRYAGDLILGTNLKCEDIAFSVGYLSFSHFSSSFKEYFGMSPMELRKNTALFKM